VLYVLVVMHAARCSSPSTSCTSLE